MLATNIVTADQYMAVVLPARMFKKAIAERGLAPVVLSRAVGASGMPTSALIPWNSCGAYMAATLGVAALSYLPYAVFNFATPLLTIALAYAGCACCAAKRRKSRLGGVRPLREPVLNSARHAPVVARSDLAKLIEQVDGLLRHGRRRASPCSWLRFCLPRHSSRPRRGRRYSPSPAGYVRIRRLP